VIWVALIVFSSIESISPADARACKKKSTKSTVRLEGAGSASASRL
jgi:hypothetical protein